MESPVELWCLLLKSPQEQRLLRIHFTHRSSSYGTQIPLTATNHADNGRTLEVQLRIGLEGRAIGFADPMDIQALAAIESFVGSSGLCWTRVLRGRSNCVDDRDVDG